MISKGVHLFRTQKPPQTAHDFQETPKHATAPSDPKRQEKCVKGRKRGPSTEGGLVNAIAGDGVGGTFVCARRARTGERRGGHLRKDDVRQCT